VFRIIGGRISKTSTIAVTNTVGNDGYSRRHSGLCVAVPSATDAGGTTSILVYGNSLTVTAGGVTQTITCRACR